MARYRPEMSAASLEPASAVTATDEYGNVRQLRIAGECALTLYLDRYELVTLMTLGQQPEWLALGYLKNQGLIEDYREIRSVQVDWETEAAAVSTSRDEDWRQRLQKRTVTTGCGQGTVYGDLRQRLARTRLRPARPLRQSEIYALLRQLASHNQVYRAAGAVHGCALCRGEEVLIFAEDVGRHNAVDIIAGKMWLEETDGADKVFYTTGRLTSEMVIKVAQMGIPALLSRSGITRMGLELARQTGIVMLARVQGRQHFLVYHGDEHVVRDLKLPRKLAVAGGVAAGAAIPGRYSPR